jgi:hypothetical protein
LPLFLRKSGGSHRAYAAPISRYTVFKERSENEDCVVADAVTIEPVSGLQHAPELGKIMGNRGVAACVQA